MSCTAGSKHLPIHSGVPRSEMQHCLTRPLQRWRSLQAAACPAPCQMGQLTRGSGCIGLPAPHPLHWPQARLAWAVEVARCTVLVRDNGAWLQPAHSRWTGCKELHPPLLGGQDRGHSVILLLACAWQCAGRPPASVCRQGCAACPLNLPAGKRHATWPYAEWRPAAPHSRSPECIQSSAVKKAGLTAGDSCPRRSWGTRLSRPGGVARGRSPLVCMQGRPAPRKRRAAPVCDDDVGVMAATCRGWTRGCFHLLGSQHSSSWRACWSG